jgi:hypothetical protein
LDIVDDKVGRKTVTLFRSLHVSPGFSSAIFSSLIRYLLVNNRSSLTCIPYCVESRNTRPMLSVVECRTTVPRKLNRDHPHTSSCSVCVDTYYLNLLRISVRFHQVCVTRSESFRSESGEDETTSQLKRSNGPLELAAILCIASLDLYRDYP